MSWPSIDHPTFARLSPHQRGEVAKALTSRCALLTGSPGTGKTFCVAAISQAITDLHGRQSLAIMAPTGKAASRAKLALFDNGIEFDVKTIHRTLKVESADGGWTFRHGLRNPLPFQYLIGDEWSMVGLSLDCSVMEARSRGVCILKVGDCEQLSPVDYGAPFRDQIAAGLARGNLLEIRRNAGTIVRACAQIRDRVRFDIDDRLDLQTDPPKNLVLIPAARSVAQQKVVDLVRSIRDTSPFDAVWQTQVCVAVNKKSEVSRVELNKVLQEELNPNGATVPGCPFRVGDKIKCCKNSFFTVATRKGQEKELCANGEFGKVLEIAPNKLIVQFFAPDRIVIVPRGKAKEADDGDEENGKENGKNGDDAARDATGCDLQLAYAATVHSMQGSSAPVIVGCLDEYPGASGTYGVMDRSWLYTLISRAEKACFLVGNRYTADSVCRRQFIGRRKTFMSQDLRTLAAAAGVRLGGEGEGNEIEPC